MEDANIRLLNSWKWTYCLKKKKVLATVANNQQDSIARAEGYNKGSFDRFEVRSSCPGKWLKKCFDTEH